MKGKGRDCGLARSVSEKGVYTKRMKGSIVRVKRGKMVVMEEMQNNRRTEDAEQQKVEKERRSGGEGKKVGQREGEIGI